MGFSRRFRCSTEIAMFVRSLPVVISLPPAPTTAHGLSRGANMEYLCNDTFPVIKERYADKNGSRVKGLGSYSSRCAVLTASETEIRRSRLMFNSRKRSACSASEKKRKPLRIHGKCPLLKHPSPVEGDVCRLKQVALPLYRGF